MHFLPILNAMTRVNEALRVIALQNPALRAVDLAGLISTLFKIQGFALIVTGELAYTSYAATSLKTGDLELAAYSGKLTPRLLQEIMGGQLHAQGSVSHWTLLGISIRFHFESALALRNLCRDFTTNYGVVKLRPAEEITAERILAAVFPSSNSMARGEALTLLTQGLVDAFQMDWIALRDLCHRPEYQVGEELAQLRTQANLEASARGLVRDQIGHSWTGETKSIPSKTLEDAVLSSF